MIGVSPTIVKYNNRIILAFPWVQKERSNEVTGVSSRFHRRKRLAKKQFEALTRSENLIIEQIGAGAIRKFRNRTSRRELKTVHTQSGYVC